MSRRLVPLLPRPREDDEPTESVQSTEDLTFSLRPKRAVTSTACGACRRRKTRCNGERPRCGPCTQRGMTCEYKPSALEAPPTALISRYKAYEDLYKILQNSHDDDVALVVRRIQAGEDVETIVRSIEDCDLLLQVSLRPEWRFRYDIPGHVAPIPPHLERWPNPYLKSKLVDSILIPFGAREGIEPSTSQSAAEDKKYTVPYHAAKLASPSLDLVDLTNYTTVSGNKPLLRSLLEIYLLYEYPFDSFFNADFFLDDIVHGEERHCSPSLVNAVLAAAWHGHKPAKQRAEYWRPGNLGYQFLAEAKRLLELEQTDPSITTVQAAGVISLVYDVNGLDELGWRYLHLSVEMAHRIGLFNPDSRLQGKDSVAAMITSWSLFNWQSWVCYHNFRPPLMRDPPQHNLPTVDKANTYFGEIFIRYPGSESPVSICRHMMFHCLCEFRIIMNRVGSQLFDTTDKPCGLSLENTYDAHDALHSWYLRIPEAFTPPNIALPGHLMLHIQYYVLLISIFEPHKHVSTPESMESPKEIIARAKACFETLLRMYYLRHGFETYDFSLFQYLPLLAFSSLRDVEDVSTPVEEQQGLRSTLLLSAKGLWEQGRNMAICKPMFSQLRDAVKDPELQREISQFADNTLDEGLLRRELRSKWPIGQFNIQSGFTALSVTDYLRQSKATHRGAEGTNSSEVVEILE